MDNKLLKDYEDVIEECKEFIDDFNLSASQLEKLNLDISKHIDIMKYKIVKKDSLKSSIMCGLYGDSYGVPYEFRSAHDVSKTIDNIGTNIISGGIHGKLAGYWSDDGALLLATYNTVKIKEDIYKLPEEFLKWRDEGKYAVNNDVFDIGMSTDEAIRKISKGYEQPTGGIDTMDNGNGSLMRILGLMPLLVTIKNVEERFKIVKYVSSITHAHPLSYLCCFLLCEFAYELYFDNSRYSALSEAQKNTIKMASLDKHYDELIKMDIVMEYDYIYNKPDNIESSGYVVDTLSVVLDSIMSCNNTFDSIIYAARYGEDTDTSCCITGTVAGLYFGLGSIPEQWFEVTKDYISECGCGLSV